MSTEPSPPTGEPTPAAPPPPPPVTPSETTVKDLAEVKLTKAAALWTSLIFGLVILTILLVGHLYFTFVYKAISSMTTGYVSKEDAEIEHRKWVEEIEHASVTGD